VATALISFALGAGSMFAVDLADDRGGSAPKPQPRCHGFDCSLDSSAFGGKGGL
jgi:hypothetical protein